MLKGIAVDKLEDPDVIAYVDMTQRCASVAEELGIDRASDPNSKSDVAAKLDLTKLTATMIAVIKDKGFSDAARLVRAAYKIQAEIPLYQELDTKLGNKYGTQPPIPPAQFDIDKKAFLRARHAVDARTWSAALLMLKQIDANRLDDPDVITYVDMTQRCASVADELGIDRASDPNSGKDVISKLDWITLATTLIDKGVGGAARLLAAAKRIHDEIPLYLELDANLVKKYGEK
jgi:hypothetical protein